MRKYIASILILLLLVVLAGGCNVNGPGVFYAAAQAEKVVQDELSESPYGAQEVYYANNIYYVFTGSRLLKTQEDGTYIWKSVTTPDGAGTLTDGAFIGDIFYGSFIKSSSNSDDIPEITLHSYDIAGDSWTEISFEGNGITKIWGGDAPYITYTAGTGENRTQTTATFDGGSIGSPVTGIPEKAPRLITNGYMVVQEDGKDQIYTLSGATATKEGDPINDTLAEIILYNGTLYAFGRENNSVYTKSGSGWTEHSIKSFFIVDKMIVLEHQGELMASSSRGIYTMKTSSEGVIEFEVATQIIDSEAYYKYLRSSAIKCYFLDGGNLILGGASSVNGGTGAVWLVDGTGMVELLHQREE